MKLKQVLAESDGGVLWGMALHRYKSDFLEMMAEVDCKIVWSEMKGGPA